MLIKSTFSKNTIVQRNSENDILKTDLGDEMVIMDIETGNYLSINKIGKLIWEMIEQPISVRILLETLTKRFDITEGQCFDECERYLAQMLQHKLIKMHNNSKMHL